MKLTECQVTTEHRPSTEVAIRLKQGESLLSFEERNTKWKGWLWCRTGQGLAGWVPRSYLTIKGGQAVANRDYDGNELHAKSGEELIVEGEEADWLLCSNAEGDIGWVPRENVNWA